MAIAGRDSVVPLELRLQRAKKMNARGLTSFLLAVASMLRRGWWYTKSYVPIMGILLLAAGSLLLLQFHWLSRRLLHVSAKEKAVIKDMGCSR